MFNKIGHWLFAAGFVAAVFLSWQHVQTLQKWSPMVWGKFYPSAPYQPFFHTVLIPNAGQNSTHSVSATRLPSGDLIAFWFAGSREGGKDVQIFQSQFQQQSQTWNQPHGILNVAQLGEDLNRYISKIGNPLVFVDKKKKMWLFFVTVSYGGWAGSSLNVMFSEDLGSTWGKPKRLITSPFINVSTLVRNAMFELEDGSVVLPVYHEFVGQFPELLRVSSDGEVLSKQRICGNGGGIQPVFTQGAKQRQVYALMRSGSHATSKRVKQAVSEDDGEHWSACSDIDIPNPNSAQVVVRVDEKLWMWIGNFNEEDRRDLTLAVTDDLNGAWKAVYQFEHGAKDDAFSYPAITQSQDGVWNLMYTYKRKNIKHVQFNRAWLDVHIKAGAKAP